MNTRLKNLRKALGLTQQEFADRIKIKRNTVATYEIGRSVPTNKKEVGVSPTSFNITSYSIC